MRLTVLIIWVLLACGCEEQSGAMSARQTALQLEEDLLQQDLWVKRDAYDAAHMMMLPMHGAFALRDDQREQQYGKFFERWAADAAFPADLGNLTALQFLYFASRYSVLTIKASPLDQCTFGSAVSVIRNHVAQQWRQIVYSPAWQWGRDPFPSIPDRIRWRLAQSATDPSYYRALIDEDLFAMAIAADLVTIATACGDTRSAETTDLYNLGLRVFHEQIEIQPDGRWLLQPGVWSDHPDYRYAGHNELAPNLESKPVPGIATDSSHYMRTPAILASLLGAAQGDEAEHQYLVNLRTGLSKQLLNVVLVPAVDAPSGYLSTTNYMDGRDGVYRYNYTTTGDNLGYGPAQLSASLFIGWWGFLQTAEIADLYRSITSQLPLTEGAVDFYIGPNTTRDRNPAFEKEGFLKGVLPLLIANSVVDIYEVSTAR